jgi:hypothetical protein
MRKASSQSTRELPARYNENMARGWESKSVEAQIEQSNTKHSANSNARLSAEQKQLHVKRSSLILSRASIARQLESCMNERYAQLLQRTLDALDCQIAQTA